MRGTGVVVLYTVVFGLYFDFVQHCLEFTDGSHVVVNAEKISFGVVFLFFFKALVVSAKRNGVEFNISGFKNLTGIYILAFRHDLSLLCRFSNLYQIYIVNIASRITSQTVGWGNTIFCTSETRCSFATIAAAP